MRRSGYQMIFHIYLIFFLAFVMTIFVVCYLFAMIITTKAPNNKIVRSDWAKNFTVEFSDYIIFVNDMPRITQAGIEILQDNHIGMQILDAEGREICEYQSPDIARKAYSHTELLQLNQTAHKEDENITAFIGIITKKQKEYVYILHFPINIEKVTMYLSGESFFGGKKIVAVAIGILVLTVIFLGM